MDRDNAFAQLESKSRGDCGTENLGHFLHFEIVVSRAERAHFTLLSLPREFRHQNRE